MKKAEFINYLSNERKLSSNTVISYQSDLNQFLSFLKTTYNIENLAHIDVNIIRSWLTFLISKKITGKSVNRKIACLRTYFRFLHINGFIEQNLTKNITNLKTEKKLPVFIQESKMKLLNNDTIFENSFEGIRDKLILELLYCLGIRLSELINIKVANLNLINYEIKINGKGNKQRIIPFNIELNNLLNQYLSLRKTTIIEDSEYLITLDNGKKLYPKFVHRKVSLYLNKIGVTHKKSPHVIRHTFATHMLNNGADIESVKQLLGHQSLAATQIYTHNTFENLKSIYKNKHPRA